MAETIRIERDARGVATLWLARAGKHNALSGQMIAEITQAAGDLGADPAVRAVVLSAEGKSFCAGGDLGWMRDQIAASSAERADAARALAEMLGALNALPKPLIGRVHGNAFGGGVGLACICDVTLGAEGAIFGLTETKLGLIPATIGPYVLARMGEANARQVFMSSRLFGADEAARLGILSRVIAPQDLDAAVEAEIAPYLICAPGAVAEAKALARRYGPPLDRAAIEDSVAALVTRWESPEAAEGITAFFDKRPARFAGG